MSFPYRCPYCKTNKSRFNIIEQVPHSVKKDPISGNIIQEFPAGELEPFHLPYNGPQYKIQCAVCGAIEDEIRFIKFGQTT
jgi:hypothetical protein